MNALVPLLGCLALAAPPAASPDLEFASTRAVIAGVLTWQNPTLSPFSARHRKDQEFFDLLGARGVPANARALLLDSKATRAAILAEITRSAAAVAPGGTFVFYYAGHGLSVGNAEVYLASWDLDPLHPRKTGLAVSDLAPAIAAGFKGARVLLFADCCYSGALQRAAEQLGKRGIAAAAVTSADASNISTGNWTFTQTLLDALRGDPLSDRDTDGRVTLAELGLEVGDAMKYRERQRCGRAIPPALNGLGLARREGALTATDLRFPPGRYLSVQRAGRPVVGRVRGAAGPKLSVELFDYSDKSLVEVAPEKTAPITFKTWPVGANLVVSWSGRQYPAKVLQVEDGFQLITYVGWSSAWDEWVGEDRVVEKGGTASRTALVEWNGERYPAVVLQEKDGRYRVHYVGYADTWDEWVGPDRINLAAAAVKVGSSVKVQWDGKWYPARVLAVDGARTQVHYEGFGAEWDEWVGPERMRQ